MSPRARITGSVDFEVDIEIDQKSQPRSKTVSFRVSRNEPDMLAWLEARYPNRSAPVARLVDEFVRRNGTDDIFEELPVEHLMTSSEESPPRVRISGSANLAWVNNQRNASASIRHVIRQHIRREAARAATRNPAPRSAPRRSTAQRRPVLAQTELHLFTQDTCLMSWLSSEKNEAQAIRRGLVAFIESNGCAEIHVASAKSRFRTADLERKILVNIFDSRIAAWLLIQRDPDLAVHEALRWYVAVSRGTRMKSFRSSARTPVTTRVATIEPPEEKVAIHMIPVGNTSVAKETEAAETLRRVVEMQKQLTSATTVIQTISGQIDQLMPGVQHVTA